MILAQAITLMQLKMKGNEIMKKITIFCLYWLMNLIRYVLVSPFYMIKYIIVFMHYVFELGFCFSLFNMEETYKPFKDIIDDIDSDIDMYWMIFLFLILPGFFLVIPAFIIRHIYFIWLLVQEKYNQLNCN